MTKLFNEASCAKITNDLSKVVPGGIRKENAFKDTCALMEASVDLLSRELEANSSPVRLWIEADEAKRITGLLVFNGKRGAQVAPFIPSAGFVRLKGEVIFLAHPDGAKHLIDALAYLIEEKGR